MGYKVAPLTGFRKRDTSFPDEWRTPSLEVTLPSGRTKQRLSHVTLSKLHLENQFKRQIVELMAIMIAFCSAAL